MCASENESSLSDQRRESRDQPYPYLPHVVIDPDSDSRLTGFVRNVSRKGFSAEFETEFPYTVGDVLDVRVGYQRAWAEVVWKEEVFGSITVAGFELHPEKFLGSVLESQSE